MSQRLVHRPARVALPEIPTKAVELTAPPQPPDSGNGLAGIMQVLLPILGGAGSLVLILANRNPLMLVAGGILLAVTIVGGLIAFIAQRSGANRRATALLARYVEYLDGIRAAAMEDAAMQRQVAELRHPAPGALADVVRDPARLWERRRRDPDFLVVRIGLGVDRLARPLTVGTTLNPLAPPDPLAQAALQRLLEQATAIDAMPVAVPLEGVVSVVAPATSGRDVLRALLGQVAALHAPDDVRIALCSAVRSRADFDWVKWLPHTLAPSGFDGPVPRRLVARDGAELETMLRAEVADRVLQVTKHRRSGFGGRVVPTPRLVVVSDQLTAPEVNPLNYLPDGVLPAELGISVITLVERRDHEPAQVDVRVTVDGADMRVEDLRPAPASIQGEADAARRRVANGATRGRLDDVSLQAVAALARRLSPLRLVEDAAVDVPLEQTIDLAGLVGVTDVGTYPVDALWAPRVLPDFLRVPFGLGAQGQQVFLDLKESAQNGMGPHGLCVGATGSGKSEVLRTLVLTLAMTHPPDRLALVLVDYKGGATFAGLGELPHTAAMVSNLSDDTGLVDRLRDAIRGEINRRQQLLLDVGSLPNTTAYNARRDAGQDLPPLPNLFVVIDEFGEMLTAKPDFIELFLQIGRIGRSIGVHLLLASQRLEEGRLKGLESYLSYRLGLRTFNDQESRTVLGVPDAYELPPIPGSGYLKVDTTVFDRFKAAYVSGTYLPRTDEAPRELPARPMPYPLFNDTARWLAETRPAHDEPDAAEEEDVLAPTVLDTVVGRMAEIAGQVRQIWLPPLPAGLAFDTVLGELVTEAGHGLTVADARRRGRLRFPLGLLDKPAEQWQGPMEIDLSGGAGHVTVMGAPQSGKSGALRTLIAAGALTHTPSEIAFYCLDFGGGALAAIADLPHVGGVAGRLEPDRVRRTIAEFQSILTEREQIFASHRFDSADAMRAAQRAGRLPELAVADVFLVIDNWTVFKEDFEDLVDAVHEIGNRGLGYGVHLVIATGRWADFRLQLQSIIGTKLELRLNDAADSTIDRKAVANIRADTPGRVVIDGGLTAQLCLARLDGDPDPATAQDGLDALVKAVHEAWPGNPVPEIRMLPTLVDHAALRRTHPEVGPVLLGLAEADLGPVRLDLFGADPHLIAFADAESGKTSLARLIVREMISRYTEDEVVFAVFDMRRTLLDIVPEAYLGAYAGTPPVAQGMAGGVASELRTRMPPDDVTTTQLRERSWWKGPEIVVLADDYDLLSPAGPGPLAPFLEFLPQARDLGLHMILLRRAGGAGRSLHEPVMQRLKELGATGLVMSGDRQEGALWPGAHLSAQPPGRGLLVRRGQKPAPIQLAYLPEER